MRQFDAALFERVVLSPAKVSPLVAQIHPHAANLFKDSYLVEFLDLPATHLESDLQRGLLVQLRQFLCSNSGATSVLWAVNTPAGSGASRKFR